MNGRLKSLEDEEGEEEGKIYWNIFATQNSTNFVCIRRNQNKLNICVKNLVFLYDYFLFFRSKWSVDYFYRSKIKPLLNASLCSFFLFFDIITITIVVVVVIIVAVFFFSFFFFFFSPLIQKFFAITFNYIRSSNKSSVKTKKKTKKNLILKAAEKKRTKRYLSRLTYRLVSLYVKLIITNHFGTLFTESTHWSSLNCFRIIKIFTKIYKEKAFSIMNKNPFLSKIVK